MICPTIYWDRNRVLALVFVRIPRVLAAHSKYNESTAEIGKDHPPPLCRNHGEFTHIVCFARSLCILSVPRTSSIYIANKRGVNLRRFTPFYGHLQARISYSPPPLAYAVPTMLC